MAKKSKSVGEAPIARGNVAFVNIKQMGELDKPKGRIVVGIYLIMLLRNTTARRSW